MSHDYISVLQLFSFWPCTGSSKCTIEDTLRARHADPVPRALTAPLAHSPAWVKTTNRKSSFYLVTDVIVASPPPICFAPPLAPAFLCPIGARSLSPSQRKGRGINFSSLVQEKRGERGKRKESKRERTFPVQPPCGASCARLSTFADGRGATAL